MKRIPAFLLLPLITPNISSFPIHPQKTPTSTRLHATKKDQTPKDKTFETFSSILLEKQTSIIQSLETTLENESQKRFTNDQWGDAQTTSGGRTRVLQNGNQIEKGAVSLTILRKGTLNAERAKSIRSRHDDLEIGEGDEYNAAALSLVLHSRSPMVPTFRSDVRFFNVEGKGAWFGGGADLTPYYLFEEDITEFHERYRDLCQGHGMDYDDMKQSCDDYFYLPARDEHRGTGGIFFDDLDVDGDGDPLSFVTDLMDLWMPSWLEIVQKRKDLAYTDAQRQWQLLRRGRYLEFNLLYDRGVRFGLMGKNPRVEGVMVSAPPLIAWEYNHKIEEGSDEAKLMEILKKPRDWVASS